MSFIIKKSNRSFLKFWILIYLVIIIIFGIVYWKIANKSSGQFFVFQSDISLNTKINVFEKKLKLNVYNKQLREIIKELIVSEEYKRPIVKLNDIVNKRSNVFAMDRSIGQLWSNYYYSVFIQKGITHVKLDGFSETVLNNSKMYKVKISLYSPKKKEDIDKYKLYKYSYLDKFEKVKVINIFIKDYLIVDRIFSPEFTFYPLDFYFCSIMENSVSFLDDSPYILKDVANGTFKYPLWNFIYFSIVTITTLGYGDILPNSMLVRGLVMIETVTGVVIIGIIVSFLSRIIYKE
ncbi:potassium channel family protein [Clostridium fermenticellae]|nr:potassium channel family protein [Clostridium fermenticellae]